MAGGEFLGYTITKRLYIESERRSGGMCSRIDAGSMHIQIQARVSKCDPQYHRYERPFEVCVRTLKGFWASSFLFHVRLLFPSIVSSFPVSKATLLSLRFATKPGGLPTYVHTSLWRQFSPVLFLSQESFTPKHPFKKVHIQQQSFMPVHRSSINRS